MSIYFTFAVSLFNFSVVRAGRVLLILYAIHFGAQPFAVGILAAMFSALPMLLSWQVGKFSDHFGSRLPLIFGLVSGACGMLVPYFIPGLPALYAAAVLNGLSFAFFEVSMQNLVGLQSKPHNRVLNFSNYSLSISVGASLGPLIAGFSIDHSGYPLTCLFVALLSFVPVAMLTIWGGALPRGARDLPPREAFEIC
jgi:MFS family permease